MTVAELISELSKADPNIRVAIASSNIGFGCLLRAVTLGDAYATEKLFPDDEGTYIELGNDELNDFDDDNYNPPEPVVWLFGEDT